MANLVSILRIFIALFAVYLLFLHSASAYFVALFLTIIAFAMDGLDGYLARKLHEESELGAVLDIMGDRIVENAYWITFAVLGFLAGDNLALNAFFPIVCITRAFSVDSIRSVALSKGFTAFGEKTMQTSKIGKFICASRFMRIFYAVAKVLAFVVIIFANTPGFHVYSWYPYVSMAGIILAWIALFLCVIRGIPVLAEAKEILK